MQLSIGSLPAGQKGVSAKPGEWGKVWKCSQFRTLSQSLAKNYLLGIVGHTYLL